MKTIRSAVNITNGNAHPLSRCLDFPVGNEKLNKATTVARRCRKAKGLYEETAGLPLLPVPEVCYEFFIPSKSAFQLYRLQAEIGKI